MEQLCFDKKIFQISSDNFKLTFQWDYHPSWGFGDIMPQATCDGSLWYKQEDMGAGFCTPNIEKVTILMISLNLTQCDGTSIVVILHISNIYI